MSDLRELYQELIVDHSKHPRNFGKLEGANHRAEGFNPLCGDKLKLYLKIDDGMVTDAGFEGHGCAGHPRGYFCKLQVSFVQWSK